MSVVALKCYDRNKNSVYEGTGIEYDSTIITHYSITRSDPSTLSSKLADFKFYSVKEKCLGYEEIPLIIKKTWLCQAFKAYFRKYFNKDDFGNKDIGDCATFILMQEQGKKAIVSSTADQTASVNKSHSSIDQAYKSRVVNQGMKINVGRGSSFCSTCGPDGIVSHTFGSGDFFVINIDAKQGDVVYRSTKNGEYGIGIVIYVDVLPYPLQVFPLCMSIHHVVNRCSKQACQCQSASPTSYAMPQKFNSINNVCLVLCGAHLGSGTLIYKSIVMTCSHNVIQHEESDVSVFFKEKPYQAKVIYKVKDDEYPDIALLEIISFHDTSKPVTLSDGPAQIGKLVFAIGIPYIKGWCKADPWISSGRILLKQLGLIIVSCGVHEGFSGGCLVDVKGRMIGVICSKAFPIDESAEPLRLTEVVPINRMRNDLIEFIASQREEHDITKLTMQFLRNKTKSNL